MAHQNETAMPEGMGEHFADDIESRWLCGFWRQPGISQMLVFTLPEVINALSKLAQKRASWDFNCTAERFTAEQTCHCDWFDTHELMPIEGIVNVRIAASTLFAAIACEGMLNKFCYFNLNEGIAEIIEKLQPVDKLLVASSALGHTDIKSSHVYELLKNLMSWRNRFAHCHNTDVPANSLLKNHAEFTPKMHTFEDELAIFPIHLRAFVELASWLQDKSRHLLVKHSNEEEVLAVKHYIKELACFRFSHPQSGHLYDFEVNEPHLKSLIALRKKDWF